MIYTYFQEENKIELVMSGNITRDEFQQLTHQIESLCAMYPDVNVLLDATAVETYDFRIVLDEFKFLKNNEKRMDTVTIVSDRAVFTYMSAVLNRILDMKIIHFPADQLRKARDIVFPSRLPA